MNVKQIGIISVALLVITTGVVSAITVYSDDFEDGDTNGWDNGVVKTTSYYGTYSGYLNSDTKAVWTGGTVDTTTKTSLTGTFKIGNNGVNLEGGVGFSKGTTDRLRLFGGNGDWYFYGGGEGISKVFGSPNAGTWYNYNLTVIGNGNAGVKVWEAGTQEPNSFDVTVSHSGITDAKVMYEGVDGEVWLDQMAVDDGTIAYNISGKVTNAEGKPIEGATVSTESGLSAVTNSNGDYSITAEAGEYNITAQKQNYKSQTKTINVEKDTNVDFTLEKYSQALQIEGSNFVRPNETVKYKITYTNETGTYDVTDYSTVTSSNSTLLSVNTANQTLEAKSENTTVNITAQYSSNSLSTNTTRKYYVSYLKLSNIDTVPSAKWVQAFLGFDNGYAEGQNMEGIGSDIQWLLFMIIVMSTIAKTFDNPWAGIGSGVITAVLLWVLEYIGLGLLLSSVFFGIFVGLILVRVRRDGGNEVTINES